MSKKSNEGLIILGLVALGVIAYLLLKNRTQEPAGYQPAPQLASEGTWVPKGKVTESRPGDVIYKNTEEWEIVSDPKTGDISKIIVHRTATRSK